MASLASKTAQAATKMVARQANQATQGSGSAVNSSANSNSASTVLSTLIPVFLVALVWFGLFLVIRSKFPRWYRPRTFMGALREP